MRRSTLLAAIVLASSVAPARLAAASPAVAEALAVTPYLAAAGQRQARVAAAPDGFLVVWSEGIGGRSSIHAARVGLDGASLDPTGFPVVGGPGGQFEPAVAWGHGVYYVVWSDMRGGDHVVRGARVTPAGEVLDPGGVALSTEPTTARMADVAATADGFVVAWAQADPALYGFVARALRLAPDGWPADPEPLRVTDVEPYAGGEDFGRRILREAICQHVRVAVQGRAAMMVWGGTVGRQQGYFIVRALLDLETGASSLEPADAVPDAASRIYNPAIAAFGAGFLFGWTDFRERGGQGMPRENVGLLALDGTTAYAPLRATAEARVVLEPAVAPNGLVAFVSPYSNPARQRRTEWHLVVRRVLADASSPGDDVLAETEAAWPALATHASGVSLLAYTLVNAPEGNGMLRARLVTVP